MRCPGDEILRVFARDTNAHRTGVVATHIKGCKSCLSRLPQPIEAPPVAAIPEGYTPPAAERRMPHGTRPPVLAQAKSATPVVEVKTESAAKVAADAVVEAPRRPAASRRRMWSWVVATGATAGLVAAAMVVKSRRDRGVAGDPCGDSQARLAGVWDPAARGEVERAFAASGQAHAAAAFAAVSAKLDAHTAQWATKRGQGCEASRASCFDTQLARVRAIGELLRTADAVTIDRAAALASTVAPLTACEAPGAPALLPADAVARAEHEHALTGVERVRALTFLGKTAEATSESELVLARARALDAKLVLAEALLARAELAAALRDRDQAAAHYREALEVARAGSADRAAAAALLGLVRHGGEAALLAEAEALIGRVDPGGALEGELRDAHGALLLARGELAPARDQLTRAVTLRAQVFGRQSPEVAASLALLGTVERDLGDHARAVEASQESIAILAQVYGADHPDLVQHHAILANELELLGRFAAARDAYLRGAEVAERVLGARHVDTGGALYDVARLERFLGDLEAAKELAGRARRVFERDPRMLARVMGVEAGIHFDEGDYALAADVAARAYSLEDKTLPAEHLQRARSLHVTGTIMLMTGDLAGARAALEAGLAMREKLGGPEDVDVVMSLTWLAMLEDRAGRHAQAVAYVERALVAGTKALDAQGVHMVTTLEMRGKLQYDRGELEEARRAYGRAIELVEKAFGSKTHPRAGNALVGMAEINVREQDVPAAETHFEQALAALAKEPIAGLRGQRRADAAFGLAKLLWARADQRTRARELVTDAITTYQAGGPASAAALDTARRWLRQRSE